MINYFKLLVAFSLLLTFTACGDDDVSPDALVGTWQAVSFTLTGENTTELNGSTTVSMTDITAKNLDYAVTFTESSFTAEGSYDIEFMTEVNGADFPMNDESYSDVNGNGTYTTDGNMITLNNPLFVVQGTSGGTITTDQQVATYEITNDGQLIFTQDETQVFEASGSTTTAVITSESVWERQ